MDNSFEKLINRVLDSRYKIENVVGIGGMAYVLKAIDLKQEGRPVAIKILNQEFNGDENAVKRFVNESEAVAMVDSPNIVKIYDVAISENLKYIVMEFVDGITLKDYIDKVGALGWKEAVHYVRQILNALSHAHEKGIIHRDIKPQNVMLLRDGTVKVTDFGIAKTPTSEPLTMTDKAIGTVNYISPEQASGGKVDEKSDLYSVGVMLYEMLTGTLPFKAESPVAVAMMQVSEEPVAPREINPQIPVGLEQIVIKSMSKDPAARFNCASSMEKAIEYFVKNPAVVFSGVAANTGTTEEARYKKKLREKDEKKLNSRRKHRSMFPIVLGITLAFFTVVIVSISLIWNGYWKSYEEKYEGQNLKGVKSVDELDFADKIVIFIDHLMGVEGNNSETRVVVVEDYVGQEYTSDLKAQLEAMGFVVNENRMRKEEGKPFNQILSQDPKSGTELIDPKAGGNAEITFFINNYTEKVYKVPSCIGYGVEKAKAKIKRDLSELFISDEMIKIVEEYDDEAGKGTVFDMSPEAGSVIDTDDIPESITLYVSKGPEPEEKIMPDVVGLSKEEAAEKLEAEGITFTAKEEFSREVEIGKVIKTNIEADTIFLTDEEVIVYFSIGEDPNAVYTMPGCAGMPVADAKKKIADALEIPESMINVVEEYSDTVESGRVISCTPAAESVVFAVNENTVTLYVSIGRQPRMPEVIYETEERAKTRLVQAGIRLSSISVEYVSSVEDAGIVVDCNYTYGALIDENIQVILYVSESEDKTENRNNETDEEDIDFGNDFGGILDEAGYE